MRSEMVLWLFSTACISGCGAYKLRDVCVTATAASLGLDPGFVRSNYTTTEMIGTVSSTALREIWTKYLSIKLQG